MKEINLSACTGVRLACNPNITILITENKTYFVYSKEYNHDKKFKGSPLYVGARYLFDLLGSSAPFSDIVSGAFDWSCRKEWLNCFSNDQINIALAIEKQFSNTNNMFRVSFLLKNLTTSNVCSIWKTVQNSATILTNSTLLHVDTDNAYLLEQLNNLKQKFNA